MKTVLRQATIDDAPLLLFWRNDRETRKASHNTEVITPKEHKEWLKNTISNKEKQLYIYEELNTPVGTARIEILGNNSCELSWTVAPEHRGRGVAKRMLENLMNVVECKQIFAEVKENNKASQRIAESIGMRFIRKKGDIIYFERS